MKYESAGQRFPFSIADTCSGPILRVPDNGTVELEYRDYRDELVVLIFHDVLGVKFQSTACDESGWADDLAIEVIDSEWLRKSCEFDGLDPGNFRHLIVGFNERSMVLEVLFRTIEVANKTTTPSGRDSNPGSSSQK